MSTGGARRPMADGLLTPREKQAGPVREGIVQTLVPKARTAGETLAFSVPAAIAGKEAELVYHEATLRKYFQSLGYRAIAVNEGLAGIFSGVEGHNLPRIRRERQNTPLNTSH